MSSENKKSYLSPEMQEINESIERELAKEQELEELELLLGEPSSDAKKFVSQTSLLQKAEAIKENEPLTDTTAQILMGIYDEGFELTDSEMIRLNAYWRGKGTPEKAPKTSNKKVHSGGTQGSFAGQSWTKKACTHEPTLCFKDDGIEVYLGKKYDVKPFAAEYGVCLNLTGDSIAENHIIPIRSLKKWANYEASNMQEIVLDWPDYGIVNFPIQFWYDLLDAVKENGKKLLIFCIGGHGRTGTAFAAIMIAYGHTAAGATKWIRENYCDQAIESKSQEDYLVSLEAQHRKAQVN